MKKYLAWFSGRALASLVGATLLATLVSGCALLDSSAARKDLGDEMAAELRPGMSIEAVEKIARAGSAPLLDFRALTIADDDALNALYETDYFPRDLFDHIHVGSDYTSAVYEGVDGTVSWLHCFFDKDTQQLIGWTHRMSDFASEKYRHETFTEKLALAADPRDRLTRAQVHQLLGVPLETIAPPAQRSPALLQNHVWFVRFSPAAPTLALSNAMEIYEYPLAEAPDTVRRVYVIFSRNRDELIAYGYDHAWEEAQRYLKQRTVQPRR